MSLPLTGAGPTGAGGTFTPTSITGLLAWWDFSALGLTNGTSISSVTDGSGNSNTLTQATGANQPTFQTGIQNGRAMAQFNGTSMQMSSPLTATTKPITTFALVRPTTNFTTTRAFLGSSVSGGLEVRLNTSGVQEAAKPGVLLIGGASTAESLNVAVDLGFTYDSSGFFQFYSNGTANGTLQQNNTTFAASTVVVGVANGGDFALGYIGELLIYNSVLSTSDRQSVEGFLRTKWGTP